ncbi:MerR family transcriptional regulator [Hymenobacter actinosclerus]|uniref:DNA-binding transcriptional regulator, MerR family n=1 Tax=Hymenobacter actinosclerus TaxID=82805 RepID=A0A1I0FKI5_9BACT|nr:MerR family transcriptional regulator [Hymenobacter actinosclerus]SET58562.1 DNA-binding transcriptional regulator, MerR family [Hymenobacter actinosclerus]
MGYFSISDLEQLSGVKAHTIRIWEQRYGILNPARTATNIRTYCEDDLRRLLNVATLCDRGYRISKVASLSEEELSTAVLAGNDATHNYCQRVNGLLAAMLAMDECQLVALFNQTIEQLGLEEAILRVAYPFLQRIGIMWQAGTVNPAQEHLVTNLLRQKMLAGTDALPPVSPTSARRWVLFLPEREMHELALLFMNYVLRARRHHVLYLGQNLPTSELRAVCASYQPHALLTVLTAVPERDEVGHFVQQLREYCPGTQLYLYGPLAQLDFPLPSQTTRLTLITDFIALVDASSAVAETQR